MAALPRRQVDLSVVRPRDLEITFGCDDSGHPIHPDPDEPTQPRWLAIRGRFSADEMLEMLAISERVEQIKTGASRTSDDAKELLFAVNDVTHLMASLIGERYDDVKVPPLSIEEAMMMLSVLVGNPGGPTEAVREALDAGAPAMSDGDKQELVEEILDKLERGETLDPPTRSGSDSSPPSSTSESSTSGVPSGGATAPGEPSAVTSSELTAV